MWKFKYIIKYLLILFLIITPMYCIHNHFNFIKDDYLSFIILVLLYFLILFVCIFVVISIKNIIKFSYQYLKKYFQKNQKNQNDLLLNDEIFKDYPEDKVSGLFNIVKSYEEETFFSIGLIGDWGSGKSSFLNKLDSMLIEIEIEKNKYVVINLNVWELGNQANLLQELQKELDNKILEHDSFVWILEIMKGLVRKNYFSILKKYYSFDKSLINIALSPTIKDSKDQYSKTLKQAFNNKKLIIMIDELDRVEDTKEIYQVFNTIRYLTSFDNTITITAIDINQIQSKIQDIEYIHKIFNTKYFIPIHSKNDLAKFLKESLQKIEEKFKIQDLTNHLLETKIDNKTLVDAVSNFRELKHSINDTLIHINTLQYSCPEWKNYISVEFIFILNFIKAINFKVYNKIYQMENLELTTDEMLDFNGKQIEEELSKMIMHKSTDKIEKELQEYYTRDIELLEKIWKLLLKESNFILNDCFYVYKYFKIKKQLKIGGNNEKKPNII